jgi:hypothetical protein
MKTHFSSAAANLAHQQLATAEWIKSQLAVKPGVDETLSRLNPHLSRLNPQLFRPTSSNENVQSNSSINFDQNFRSSEHENLREHSLTHSEGKCFCYFKMRVSISGKSEVPQSV